MLDKEQILWFCKEKESPKHKNASTFMRNVQRLLLRTVSVSASSKIRSGEKCR